MSHRNVLLKTTGEQRYDALGCNGNPHVLTPCLDGLAGQSVRFSQHRCLVLVCTPARLSMLKGLYARSRGAWHCGAGDAAGLFGKAHFEGELSSNAEQFRDADW